MIRSFKMAAAAAVFAVAASVATPASAAYPDQPIRIICSYVAGGGADIIVRYFARQLEKVSGQSVIVENRPGAFGNIGTQTVVQSKPDGYRLLMSGTSTVVGNLFLIKDIPFDPINDLVPVSPALRNGFVLTVAPNSPVKNVPDLVALLKSKPKARYGQSSANSLASAELMMQMTGTKAERVSYKSSGELIPDMIAGDLDFAMLDAVFSIQQAKQGRLKLIAGTPDTRIPGAADLPTMIQAGLPNFEFSANWLTWFPKGTPAPIVKQMNEWINQIVKMPETKEFLATNGADPVPGTIEDANARIKTDHETWAKIAVAAKLEKQ